jgi:capsular exopolysaccharide synthesis family protein
VFFAILLGFIALVVLWTAVAPRSYTATVKLIAGNSSSGNPPQGDSTLPVLNALIAAGSTMTAETYVDLIQEDPVVKQVISNLHLDVGPQELLNKYVDVKPVTNTSIIQLSATWGNPKMAINIANEFANVFVNRERDLIAGQAASAIDYLNQQLPIAEQNMRRADDALARFQAVHPDVYVTIGTDTQGGDSAVATATQRYAQAKVDADQARATLASVTAQMAALKPTSTGSSNVVQNPVTAQLQAQLAQVEVQLDTARKQYTDQHPTVIALEEQKAQLQSEIAKQPATIVSGNDIVPNPVYQQLSQQAATLRAQIAGDEGQMRTLGIEMGRNGAAANSLPTQTAQLAKLEEDAKMAGDIYTALQQKYSQATVARTTALSDVSITQPASGANLVVRPSWILNLILGFAIGLVLAVSGVFIVDFFDNTFKDEQDVQRALPVPLLTSVPQLGGGSPKKLPWLRALTVESFLQLVTALRYSSDKPLRTLAITSPHQGDGKTTVAMSTAIAMAEIEPKILLVDCDLRRPTLHKKLAAAESPGLSDVLVGESQLQDAIQSTKYDGLYLLTAGTLVPNPVKLIHSPRFEAVLGDLLKEYRAMVFDTPALLPVYDAAVLTAKVDGAVLVVSANTTDMPSTRKALQRLNSMPGVNVLGVVLNRATPTNGYAAYYLSDNPIPLPHENGATPVANE